MTDVVERGSAKRDPVVTAQLHAALRFATGTTASFVVSEYMGWAPSCFAPLFVATLITMLPGPPPLKAGFALVAIMTVTTLIAFLVSTLLRSAPTIMVGVIGLIIFLALGALAQRRAIFPMMLLLICIAIIPVIAMTSPANADKLPRAFIGAMAIAVVTIWCVYILWPKLLPKAAPPAAPPIDFPVKMALTGTAILLPLILAYLLFGWTDALAVLVSTVLLVINFDPKAGAAQGIYRTTGSLVGGFIGFVAFLTLSNMQSLITLALITFAIGLLFADHVYKAGSHGAIALQIFNTAMIIFSTAISSPDASSGIWITRMFQLTLAGLFAVAMMSLFWGKDRNRQRPSVE